MSSSSQDWSALASQNERVVAATAPRQGSEPRRSARASRLGPHVRGRLRLRKRAERPGTAART
jgi:hypothetical protein